MVLDNSLHWASTSPSLCLPDSYKKRPNKESIPNLFPLHFAISTKRRERQENNTNFTNFSFISQTPANNSNSGPTLYDTISPPSPPLVVGAVAIQANPKLKALSCRVYIYGTESVLPLLPRLPAKIVLFSLCTCTQTLHALTNPQTLHFQQFRFKCFPSRSLLAIWSALSVQNIGPKCRRWRWCRWWWWWRVGGEYNLKSLRGISSAFYILCPSSNLHLALVSSNVKNPSRCI